MKKILISLVLLAVLAAPVLTLAQIPARPNGNITNFDELYNKIGTAIWAIFAIIALVSFVYAGITFLTAQGDPGRVATARQAAIYGVIGIIVAVLAYSIIQIAASLLG